ncbi:MAG: antitoxin Xre/MbcA/ParS toxin-binding domain-containing protein [Bryobacteraceae bacterium]
MVDASKIADVMGGPAVLGSSVTSIMELAGAVSDGLPKAALRKTAQRLFEKPSDVNSMMYKVVPEATYKRRTRLTPTESERTERLARVIALAEYVWDDPEPAHMWMTKPHPELGGKSPIQCAMTELGARQVEYILHSLFYGIPP